MMNYNRLQVDKLMDGFLKTEAYKELVQWLEEDPAMSNETDKVREHLASLFDVDISDVIALDAPSNAYMLMNPISVEDLPDGVTYNEIYGYINIKQQYINELLYEPQKEEPTSESRNPAKNILKHEMSYMTPLHTNVAGGKQSHVARDYTLIPQEALASLARVMYNGALKYSKDNWKLIHKRDHLNHALNHVNLYLAGNTSEDHLAHAATRLMMALELELTEENDDA